jgi:hypothetical protein
LKNTEDFVFDSPNNQLNHFYIQTLFINLCIAKLIIILYLLIQNLGQVRADGPASTAPSTPPTTGAATSSAPPTTSGGGSTQCPSYPPGSGGATPTSSTATTSSS